MNEREERLAKNEALFRDVNERVQDIATAHSEPETLEILCECVRTECLLRLEVSVRTYESVRADSAQFLVSPGHEVPDVEDVIDAGPGWVIVRKHPETRPIVEELDPRR